eukprot:GFUD01000911.1.p1 GENE.GFUD01000911.1~~GFUD01000911.1.p1  ORF type:complete len:2354 (+),score=554.15 GFUD01000911.1:527-7588(+)
MVVNEEDVVNIMGGMEHAGGIKLNDHKRKLKNRFEICKKLGQGTYGKVQLGINKETGQRVAIKTIKKSKIETEADLIRIRREIQIMSSVQHPNIIHIYEVFENKEKMVLVMEIAAGGELYDYLSERRSLEELEARRIFRQIATAVFYCHKHNICHRDLKLENILLDEDGGAKIADFGLSNVFDQTNLLSTFCGSPLYASPEIVRGCPYQGPEVDCWSLGVLLYTLVYGAMPFDGSNFKRLVKQITTGDYYEPSTPSSASTLIRGMLTPKAEDRASIVDICSHWWINQGYDQSCLEEAEYLASLTPVRLDLLLSLTKAENRPFENEKNEGETDGKDTPSVDIEEIPPDTPIPDGIEECDVSLSEEPPEDRSPKVRRKKEHKRKHENASSAGELVAKKYERADDTDLQAHQPPHCPVPEPMEIVDNQVYERPRDRKKSDEIVDAKDKSKTPRVRRKHKSKEDVLENQNTEVQNNSEYQENAPEVQRKPPHKPKSPKPDYHEQNGEVIKRVVRKPKPKHVENGEPFERPEPRASPRPPRTPQPPEWDEESNVKPHTKVSPPRQTSPPKKDVEAAIIENNLQTDDSIPPPLPEKKLKSPRVSDARNGSKDKEDSKPAMSSELLNNNHVSKSANDVPSPQQQVVSMEIPSERERQEHVEPVEAMNISQNKSSQKGAMHHNTNSVPNDATNESCDSTLAAMPVKDNSTVIPQKESLDDKIVQSEKAPMESKESMSAVPTIQDKLDIHTPNVSKTSESASGKSVATAESKKTQPSQSSVGESGKEPARPAQVTQSLDQNVSPKTNNISDLKNAAAPNKKKDDSFQPLVKPFPSQPTNTKPMEFPPKNISSPEPTSIKPPWAKLENKLSSNKSLESLIKSKSSAKESTPSPSINNLPKLVTQKSKEGTPMSPKLSPELAIFKREPIQQASINNLPKLKQDSLVEKVESPHEVRVSRNDQEPSPKSPTVKQQPLVVPFPGKQQSTPTSPMQQAHPTQDVQQAHPTQVVHQAVQIQELTPPQPVPEVLNQQKEQPDVVQALQQPVEEVQPAQPKQQTAPAQLMKQDSPKSLINNIPKPFKAEIEKSNDSINDNILKASPQQPLQPEKRPSPGKQVEPKNIIVTVKSSYSKAKSTDSVGSAISLSSNEDFRDKSTPSSPMILAKPNGPNINMSTLSPSNSSSNIQGTPEKRDSKVIKAAAYWNNFIGEVTSKAKPPSNPKLLDKPKKIVSAGIGEKGLKELTSAFETGKPMDKDDKFTLMRRNSKKVNVENCSPGLRVNDAKSHFEKKFQQTPETPRMSRRASGSLEKPRWGADKLDSTPINSADASKSPSPTKSEKTMSLPQPLPKSKSTTKSPEPEKSEREDGVHVEPKKESKLKTEVQRNTVVNDITRTAVVNDPDKKSDVQKNGNEASPRPETCTSGNNLAINKDQPKPPTSPKPKVRKEELKIKEELAKSKEDKPHPQLITKKIEEPITMIAPLKASDKETAEQAVVKKLKEEPEKPKLQFLSNAKLEINHKPTENLDMQIENKDQHAMSHPLKPILRERSKELDKPSTLEIPEASLQSPDIVSSPATKHKNKEKPSANNVDAKPVVKTVKIKSPELEESSPEPKIELSDIRSSLKKVPHVAVARRKSFTEKDDQTQEAVQMPSEKRTVAKEYKSEIVIPVNSESDQTSLTQSTPPIATQTHLKTQTHNFDNNVSQNKDTDTPKERIIPIQFINENRGPKPFKLDTSSRPQTPDNSHPNPDKIESPKPASKQEHHIPIVIEGKGSSMNRKSDNPSEDPDNSEKLDNFNASSITRRRWGSRKKRMSSAFSDSSMSDDDALTTPFGGLQKYSSYGKHGPGEEAFTLRKTRPPFSVTRTESFSSGEEDFDDDGFQEMTAENLFSTLLSRVKSLTRRIHDEHDEHLSWQQKQRHGPPKLNPGGTHARLERTAQRNSIKRDRQAPREEAPTSYSRQSSTYGREDDNSVNRSYNDSPSLKSYGNSSYTPTRIYNRSNSTNDNDSRFSTGSRYSTGSGKRYEESDAASDYSSNISVTSSQRLRPGYLPPPANINTDNASNSNRTSANSNDIDAHSIAQSIINRAQDKAERSIPISIQRQNSSDSPTNSKPGTPLPTPGVYMKHMKPFTPTHTNDNSQNNSRLESPEPISDGGNGDKRRVSRFLRPDFYDIPKEDSVYAKMRELEDDDTKKPRYLRVHGRTSNSGRSTPLDYSSYNKEDRSKSDSQTPTQETVEGAVPASEGQFLNRALTLTRRNSLKEPTSRLFVANSNDTDSSPNPDLKTPTFSLVNYTQNELPVENAQLYRRTIRPYTGAKSDGQLLTVNKHANVSLNIIAAAERKKRQYSHQSTSELPQEKVNSSDSILNETM